MEASRSAMKLGTTRLSSSSSSGIFTDDDDEVVGGIAPLALIFDTETNGKMDFKKEDMNASSQPALVQWA